jgi:hypothetical protein
MRSLLSPSHLLPATDAEHRRIAFPAVVSARSRSACKRVGKALDQFDVPQRLFNRWKEQG